MEPFQIVKRISDVAYQLELPPKLSQFYNVFEVSALGNLNEIRTLFSNGQNNYYRKTHHLKKR